MSKEYSYIAIRRSMLHEKAPDADLPMIFTPTEEDYDFAHFSRPEGERRISVPPPDEYFILPVSSKKGWEGVPSLKILRKKIPDDAPGSPIDTKFSLLRFPHLAHNIESETVAAMQVRARHFSAFIAARRTFLRYPIRYSA